MKRLRRILLNAATALSLLLCVATAVLWVRSYWATDNVSRAVVRDDGNTWESAWAGATAGRGGLYVYRVDAGPLTDRSPAALSSARSSHPAGLGWQWHVAEDPSDPRRWEPPASLSQWLGFRRDRAVYRTAIPERVASVTLPLWAIAFATGALPAWRATAARVRRLRRRATAGLCPACGYDCRATPERCPECGRTTAAVDAPQ